MLPAYVEFGLLQEAGESGSVFQGLLSDSLNIYATTASNAVESSWGTYCPGMEPSPPPEFNTCLGDLYSVAFLENRFVLLPMAGIKHWQLLLLALNVWHKAFLAVLYWHRPRMPPASCRYDFEVWCSHCLQV